MNGADARPTAPLWLLALITLSGTLAMHIFVPALPVAAADLHAGAGEMQLTISLYILGLAFGQLVYGPVADRVGRRPALMTGLSLYAAASLGAAFAPGVTSLLAARLAQALGGCAGLVLGRAMVRDTAGPRDAAGRLALMNLMVIAGPGLAPIVGGLVASHLGWRAIFVFLAALGVSLLVLAATLLPETGARTHVPVRVFARNYRGLLASPVFLGLAVGGGCATTSMYAFIAAAPFIFTGELHRPPEEVGLYLALLILGAWCGSAVTGQLLKRVSLARLLVGANALSLLAALGLLATILAGQLGVASTVAAMVLFTFGAGIAAPAALTLAVGVNPAVIGSASGLYGFTQMLVGALCTALGGLGRDPALAAAAVLASAGLLAQLCFWIALRPRAIGRA